MTDIESFNKKKIPAKEIHVNGKGQYAHGALKEPHMRDLCE